MNVRNPKLTLALGLAFGLLVAGCDKKADEAAGEAAAGEVMPGSISDAMINLDTSTASPPLAPVKAPDAASVGAASEQTPQDEAQDTPPAAVAEDQQTPVTSTDPE